ncbi:MAG: LacI family DNA-binding transcriptional regulator [Bosea sp. (in: a-proteobacteria)]
MPLPRKPRLSDVARDAGVSPATVSRAISRPGLLSDETLAKVRLSAKRLGYNPDAAARALVSGKSMTIGAVMPTLDNAIFSRALQAMQVTLAEEGYQLLVASHDYNASAEAEAVRTLLSRGVDGLMLVGAERAIETLALIEAAKVPLVLTWRSPSGTPSVTVDNERAGAMAAEHLVALGHRRIGMVSGSFKFNDRQKARQNGARAYLDSVGIGLPGSRTCEQPTTLAGGRSGCAKLMELAEPPTAIIGGIDLIAIGCMIEAQARGFTVPGDLSVAGIDDLDMSAHLAPSLTTVHIPTAAIGAEAALKLVALLRGLPSDMTLDLPIELVVRRSTAKR